MSELTNQENPTGQTGTEDVSTSTSTTTPSYADLTDDTPLKGPNGETVKYGDVYKRLQADHTRKTQEAQKLRDTYERERQEWNKQKSQEEQNLRTLTAQLLQRAQGATGSQKQDLIAKLQQLTYLDGPTAAQLFNEMREGITPIQSRLDERDKVISGLYNHILQLSKQVNEMNGRFGNQDFEGKIGRWVKEVGLPAEATDLAKELYLAYEGDDLDQEFPTILQNRWNQLQNLIRNSDKQRVDAAKSSPFKLGGKGGTGSAGKPLGLTGKESAKEVTDKLWEAMQSTGSDT